MSFLTIKGVNKSYGKVNVLKDISLNINKGEFICLVGPSGCGKTTLLRIIAGLEENHNGEVFINNKNATKLPPQKRNFGIVFQSYALFPNMTVYKNIAFGLENQKLKGCVIKDKVEETLEMVELKGYENKYPSQLSGGQAQRVALARAIVLSPDFLLLDEPLSALDAKVREKLRGEIRRLQKRLGITTIMVTHDQEEALSMADRVIVMNKGEIMQIGTPQEIYSYPQNSFVADFIGSTNLIERDKSNTILSIRPEDIKIVNIADKNSLKGTIVDMEYRGAYYVALVSYKKLFIKINIGSKVVEEERYKQGFNIAFELGEGICLEKISESA